MKRNTSGIINHGGAKVVNSQARCARYGMIKDNTKYMLNMPRHRTMRHARVDADGDYTRSPR